MTCLNACLLAQLISLQMKHIPTHDIIMPEACQRESFFSTYLMTLHYSWQVERASRYDTSQTWSLAADNLGDPGFPGSDLSLGAKARCGHLSLSTLATGGTAIP